MNAFVTGVTGFAGSHLAEHLLECGDQVLGTSQSGRWGDEVPAPVRGRVELLTWKLPGELSAEDRARIEAFAPDVLYHLAALSVPADCGRHRPSQKALAVNVQGTRAMSRLAQSLRPRPRVLFTSSCYVYAPVAWENPAVSEQSPLDPGHGYGMTKLSAERELSDAARRSDLDVVIARAFQHTGPRQSPRMIVPDWAKQFVQHPGEPIRVVCLDAFLDLSDVRDVVRAYRKLVFHGRKGCIYNVGSGVCRRSGDIFEEMRQLYDPQRRIIELSPGRRQHPVADISRLTACTRWQPTIGLEKTLRDTLDYWQERISKT